MLFIIIIVAFIESNRPHNFYILFFFRLLLRLLHFLRHFGLTNENGGYDTLITLFFAFAESVVISKMLPHFIHCVQYIHYTLDR